MNAIAKLTMHDGQNWGMAPVTYGKGERPPRGDYSRAAADYTCDQDFDAYTREEHSLYAHLYRRQFVQLKRFACDPFIESLNALDAGAAIPRLEEVSERLFRKTQWQLVAVPGLIPEEAFFSLLSKRKFPVTKWLRTPAEIDYIVEPDIFHDFFGHVPLLFNPVFADYMRAYGQGGLKAGSLTACQYLARLYWYTVEFGLINTSQGLRIYGAGILSSGAESRYSLLDPTPNRVAFDLERVMRTEYQIDSLQKTYFVIDSFDDLFKATEPDFTAIYKRLRNQPAIGANTLFAGEKTFAANVPQ